MTNRKLAYYLFILGISTSAAHARLGENAQECEKRYGKPIFKNADGPLSYSTYKFSGKKIRVLFVKDKSTIEMIITGPEAIYSQEQAAEIGGESMRFLRGLLSKAYGFTEEQLQGLANVRRKSIEEAESSIQNESTQVGYSIESNQAQTTIKLTATLMDIKLVKENVGLGLGKFMGDSAGIEYKAEEAKDSGGF
ncbi:MAG: hypothetical protein ABIT37_05435 [Luteolibacter sp.]